MMILPFHIFLSYFNIILPYSTDKNFSTFIQTLFSPSYTIINLLFYRMTPQQTALTWRIIMKKILIAGHPEQTKNYEAALTALSADCVTTLNVPTTAPYDGLILPGGGDIDPKLFGQLNHGSRVIDPILDRLQLAVLKAFVLDRKPVLGICKGMQLINIYFGGDIHQNLPSYKMHQYDGQDQIHKTSALPGSFLHRLYGQDFTVNSAHHQGVDSPGRGITYVQYCLDGVVEGLTHDYLPIWGVQWHPERMCFAHKKSNAADGALLFKAFLN